MTWKFKFFFQILGMACLLLISHHDAAFFLNQRMTSSVMLFLCPTSVHNGVIFLICYLSSYKTFSMVRPSLFVSRRIFFVKLLPPFLGLFKLYFTIRQCAVMHTAKEQVIPIKKWPHWPQLASGTKNGSLNSNDLSNQKNSNWCPK